MSEDGFGPRPTAAGLRRIDDALGLLTPAQKLGRFAALAAERGVAVVRPPDPTGVRGAAGAVRRHPGARLVPVFSPGTVFRGGGGPRIAEEPAPARRAPGAAAVAHSAAQPSAFADLGVDVVGRRHRHRLNDDDDSYANV